MTSSPDDYDHITLLAIGGIAGLGVFLTLITLYNGYESVVHHGSAVWFVILENAFPLSLNLFLVGSAGWLLRADEPREYVGEISRWTSGIFGVLLLVAGWGYFFQRLTRSRPVFVFADVVSICALSGVVIGAYVARRKQRRETIQDQRRKFSTAFNNVPDATIGVDSSGDRPTIVMANPAFEELFDVDAVDIIDQPLERFTAAERGQTNGGLPSATSEWGDEEIVLESEQERRSFLRLDAPISEDGGTTYEIYMDITPRQRRQERLSVLSRTLRHDIRNKMTVIKGNASTLRDEPDHPVREQMISSIDSAADYILTMSERAYDIEESLSGPIQTDEVALVSMLEEVIEDMRDEHPACEFRLDAPETVRVSAIKTLPEAFRELLDNAAKHNDSEDPVVVVTVSPDSEAITVLIEDNGPGIPSNVRQVITGEQDRTQLNHLDGLGLWFSNWVIRDSGGRFDFQDRDPRGTKIRITLPRAE